MNRHIRKVAVIGSGIMGSGIACHFANIGLPVRLYDITPRELNAKEKKKGLTLEHPAVRNRIVNEGLQACLKSKPSPIYNKAFAKRITTGNLEDDLDKIADCDWVIEVVVERLDIKKSVFEQIEKHRKPGSLITSNTSGIPIKFMNEGRSEDFRQHFAVTHFFNPPRYLKLFEVVPGSDCKPEVVDFLMKYGEKFLGKTSVLAKDTPAFIGNRIGIYGIMDLFHAVKALDLSVEEVDKLTGPVIGRPKSATFRTVDVVGLDTLVHTANGVHDNAPNDEMHDVFAMPDFIDKMMANKWLGSKTGQGFYKKVKDKDGKSSILSLDLNTLDYKPQQKAKFPTLEMTGLFQYVSNRIPEISDELYRIDDAMKAGFGWEHGPFQIWDAIGVAKGVEMMKALGKEPAQWVKDMLEAGEESFYTVKDGTLYYYDITSKAQVKIPGQDSFIILDHIRENNRVWHNAEADIIHLGDGVLNVEFQSKMNTIGGGVLQAINKAIDMAEEGYEAVVIGNQDANYSLGANLAMIMMLALEQEYDELNMAVRMFQNATMRARYSSVPVIAAPHGMTLGGGCEISLHADKVVAAAETYIGLVEFGVGLIPAGGGTKEMTRRVAELWKKDDVKLNRLRDAFTDMAMAKVTTSAYEAFDYGFFQQGKDVVVINKERQIAAAKQHALQMVADGYSQPAPKDVYVLGKQALGMFYVGTDGLKAGHFASEHDQKIANKLGYVMAGGDLSEPQYVSEQYLLDLEREAFMSLLTERKTLERISHTLKTGKPLRN